MSIMEQLDAYRTLLDKKEQLAEAVKENNRAIEAARDALADSMVSEETVQIVRDGYSYTLTPKTKYSKAAGQDEALMDALRNYGLGSLIRETVQRPEPPGGHERPGRRERRRAARRVRGPCQCVHIQRRHPAQSPGVPQNSKEDLPMAANLMKAENFSIVPMSGEIAKMLTEELDGLGQVPFDTVKIPSGGGLAFEVPGDDPDNPETAQALTGVIVHHHPVNVYWEHDFDGSGGLPDCSSPDGKRGLDTRTGEIRDCATLPLQPVRQRRQGPAPKPAKTPIGSTCCGRTRPCPSC